MSDVTLILAQAEAGDAQAAAQLLPLVYDELRRLAAGRLAQEKPGQTLQATALVHEVFLRLVGNAPGREFAGRAHFFAAAAEAMRRILVEQARRKLSQKRGGNRDREPGAEIELADEALAAPAQLLAVHEALEALATEEPRKAELVKLRYFAGLTLPEASQTLGISLATAKRDWAVARAWLFGRLHGDE